MALNTVGSIAIYIADSWDLPAGISGNLVQTVDACRIHVQNFTGVTIGSNGIPEKFQNAITSFSKADTIDQMNSQAGGKGLKLAELSISEGQEEMSSKGFRDIANQSLKYIGRKIGFGKTLV